MAAAFKTFPAVVPTVDRDLGLELAIRRRRTKSLFGEEQLRRKIIAGLYAERPIIAKSTTRFKFDEISHPTPSSHSVENVNDGTDALRQSSVTSNRTISDIVTFEDCLGTEVAVPRDTDRILEQFVTMSLRIATYLKRDGTISTKYLDTFPAIIQNEMALNCNGLSTEHTEPPPLVGSSKGKVASYLTNYPQIFMKKTSDAIQRSKQEQHEVLDKETENKSVGNNIDYYNAKSVFPETSNIIELNKNKNNYEPRNSSTNNTDTLKENTNNSLCGTKPKMKSDISITMRPEPDPDESFEYVVNKIDKRISDNSKSTQQNTPENENNHDQPDKKTQHNN